MVNWCLVTIQMSFPRLLRKHRHAVDSAVRFAAQV